MLALGFFLPRRTVCSRAGGRGVTPLHFIHRPSSALCVEEEVRALGSGCGASWLDFESGPGCPLSEEI